MRIIGIIKKIDKLGRLVIPKELRSRYNIEAEVELITTEEGILLRPMSKAASSTKKIRQKSKLS